MLTPDKIKIEILEDGTIKVETDEVGQANHTSADRLLQMMAALAGGESTITRKTKGHHHGHVHHHHEADHSH